MDTKHAPTSDAPSDVFRHYLGEVIYGANDGIITTFTVASGVAGATLSPAIALILGFVNLLADGFSMGASSFLSIRSAAAAEGKDRGIREPLYHAGVTFAAFVVVGTIPLLSYLLPIAQEHAFLSSCIASGVALFAVGASRALVNPGGWFRSGMEMLAIGAVAAAVAYGAGALLGRWVR